MLPYELEKQYHQEMQAAIKEVEQESKRRIRESLKKGLKKGKEAGRKEGMQARNIEIARSMLKAEMPKEKVAAFTGLDHSQIDKLLLEISQ